MSASPTGQASLHVIPSARCFQIMNLANGLLLTLGLAAVASAQAPHTHRVDVAPGDVVPLEGSKRAAISADGGTAVFVVNTYSQFVPQPVPFAHYGVHAKDLVTGAVDLVNLGSAGQVMAVGHDEDALAISGDGRYVVWPTPDDDVAWNDSNGSPDIYLRDRLLGVTELISVDYGGGTPGFGSARRPSISEDGRYVSFIAWGAGMTSVPLVGFATTPHAYLRDRQTGTTLRVSHSQLPNDERVYDAAISGDGSTMILRLESVDFTLRHYDVATGADTELLSSLTSDYSGAMGIRATAINSSGSRIAFDTKAKLVAEDTDFYADVYTLDIPGVGPELVSLSTFGADPASHATIPSLSPDGRYLAFQAGGQGYVPFPVTDVDNVYVRDLTTGLTSLASINDSGTPGFSHISPGATIGSSFALSDKGATVLYTSTYLNLGGPQGVGANQYKGAIYMQELANGGPDLSIDGLLAGSAASLSITGASPGTAVLLAFSVIGQGPLPSYWGLIDLSPPLITMTFTADAAGSVSESLPLPPGLLGWPVFAKGLDLTANEATTTFFGVIQ